MNNGFEITEIDVESVANRLGLKLSDEEIDGFLTEYGDQIAKAALRGNDMDTQTEYAYEEIGDILKSLFRDV